MKIFYSLKDFLVGKDIVYRARPFLVLVLYEALAKVTFEM